MGTSIERNIGAKPAAGSPEQRGVSGTDESAGPRHPTARADGRPPTTRAADAALAAALNAPAEALELLDTTERSVV